MVSISVSTRSLAAARAVDPNVSTAAVHAAVEVAIAEHLREIRPNASRSRLDRSPTRS